MAAPVENAVLQWEDGYSRVQAATRGGGRQNRLGRVVMAVERELRKRLGSRFSVDELAEVYREQADDLLDLAMASMPDDQPLGEATAACDAAFWLYMREASDFGGGRNRPPR
jgi:heme oxygenase